MSRQATGMPSPQPSPGQGYPSPQSHPLPHRGLAAEDSQVGTGFAWPGMHRLNLLLLLFTWPGVRTQLLA